jgi:hypothetical protein
MAGVKAIINYTGLQDSKAAAQLLIAVENLKDQIDAEWRSRRELEIRKQRGYGE